MEFQRFEPALFGFLEQLAVNNNQYLDHVAASFTASRPFMRFLCQALRIPF